MFGAFAIGSFPFASKVIRALGSIASEATVMQNRSRTTSLGVISHKPLLTNHSNPTILKTIKR
jgi:hypothetical protein